MMSTVPTDGRGRYALRDSSRTDGTVPRLSVQSLTHNDDMMAGDLPGTMSLPSPAVIHRLQPTLGGYSMNFDDIEHSPESVR